MNYKENEELLERYKREGSFRGQMEKLQHKYRELSQQAYYTDFYELQS